MTDISDILSKRLKLGFFPTPIIKLQNLSKSYSDYNIFIKRDDNTGLALGGNKTRKLEYLIYDAIYKKANTIITAGAQQSNHCRQTAAACAVANLECHLLLGGEEPEDYTGNLLLSKLLGAIIHYTGDNRKGEDIPLLYEKLLSADKKPYIIPYGGSNIYGALGFINAVKEIKNYNIDYIYFPSSSGGTQAGLHIGKKLFNVNAQLMPICIDKDETEGLSLEEMIYTIIKDTIDHFHLDISFKRSEIKLIREYESPGYGVLINEERKAIKTLAEKEGILLDPVYTARAFYGLLDHLNRNIPKKGSNILFWHTGGYPAIFQKSLKI